MRILLLGFGKIAYMPYMNFYLDELSKVNNIKMDLVYWERDDKPDLDVPASINNAFRFVGHLEEQLPFNKKFKYFRRYRAFALKVLKNNSYDRVIVLQVTPGLTILDYLLRKYKGKYIVDFRDISHENISIYKWLVGKLVKGSAFTYVSSNAFRKFLPQECKKIYTIHNYLESSLERQSLRSAFSRNRDKIRICFWGLIRQIGPNIRLMDALGNDDRFELHYYGRMQQDGRDMEQHANEYNYNNVFFHGQYMPNERYDFATKTDIIHNVFNLGHTMKNAMSNKYYDGIIFRIPQICTEGSHMGTLISKQGIGLAVDLQSDSIADSIWRYYNTVDWKEFDENCKKVLISVLQEQELAKRELQKCVSTFEVTV